NNTSFDPRKMFACIRPALVQTHSGNAFPLCDLKCGGNVRAPSFPRACIVRLFRQSISTSTIPALRCGKVVVPSLGQLQAANPCRLYCFGGKVFSPRNPPLSLLCSAGLHATKSRGHPARGKARKRPAFPIARPAPARLPASLGRQHVPRLIGDN